MSIIIAISIAILSDDNLVLMSIILGMFITTNSQKVIHFELSFSFIVKYLLLKLINLFIPIAQNHCSWKSNGCPLYDSEIHHWFCSHSCCSSINYWYWSSFAYCNTKVNHQRSSSLQQKLQKKRLMLYGEDFIPWLVIIT